MSLFSLNSPYRVRAATRSSARINFFSYDTAEATANNPKSIISLYKYQRTKGALPQDASLVDSITWPLPTSFSEPSSFSYENTNLGEVGNSPTEIYNAWMNYVKEGQSRLQSMALGSMADIEANLLPMLADAAMRAAALAPGVRDTGFGQRAQLEAGVVRNPHAAVLFSGVPLRRFTLNWRFSPRSQKESNRLYDHIDRIKERIYPERNAGTYAFDYPHIARVTFPNTKLKPIRASFVENMTITNSSGASIELFRDGTPVDFDITMSFIETEIITSETSKQESS